MTEPPVARYLSDMASLFLVGQKELVERNPLLYNFWTVEPAPDAAGEMVLGLTYLYPGLVGREYHMTAGHFHKGKGAEVYICLNGQGRLLLRSRDGELRPQPMTAGAIAYIPSDWAHRMVNTGRETLKFLAVWPTGNKHDYESIKHTGFGCRVAAGASGPEIVRS